MTETCIHCGKEVSIDSAEFDAGEAIESDEGIGYCCEGCLTGEEEQAALENVPTDDELVIAVAEDIIADAENSTTWVMELAESPAFAKYAREFYRDYGRGVFTLQSGNPILYLDEDLNDAIGPMGYIEEIDFGLLASSSFGRRYSPVRDWALKELREYDPETECLVIVDEEDGIHPFRLRFEAEVPA